jgi:hypothetical protein
MSNHLGELSVENKNYDLYSSSQLGTPGNCKSNNYIGGVLVFFFFRLQSLVINLAIPPFLSGPCPRPLVLCLSITEDDISLLFEVLVPVPSFVGALIHVNEKFLEVISMISVY